MNNELYWLWLCNIEGLRNGNIRKLLNIIDTPKRLYELSSNELKDLCEELHIDKKVCNNIIYSRDFEKISNLAKKLDKKGILFLVENIYIFQIK
ncbi:MAG: hypothetical protein IJA34_08705 [Lachnospiraceae bacterium]|nr:hypothetical protein [Lachnospiraceae bacterium]